MIAMIDAIILSVEEGKSFSDSIAQYPSVFSPVYISLIKAGESTGVLDKVLVRLADTLEKRDKLRAQIRGALMYPMIVVALMIVVIGIMMIFVIPQLNTLYESLNISLPIATQIVVSLSNFVVNYLIFIIIAGAAGLFYFNKWRQTEKGKFLVDSFLLQVPVFNKLIRETIMAEFSRTFGMLAGTGALVIESLNKSADVVGNSVYKKAVLEVSANVEKGVSIGDAMNANPLFPSMIVEMVKIGEQTGKLDDSLMRVSEYFEREVEQTVKALTTAMEPMIMIGLAVGVGFLIIAVITPIYNLISSF
jgi:type IV pilus assembly protein PilC